MIIQPGIAKANLGVSREDVTLEDHVSALKPLCCRKSPRAINCCSGFQTPGLLLALFLDCENFALPAGGMVPRYKHSVHVGVAFGVNYWQSTNSSGVFSAMQMASPLPWQAAQAACLLGKERG